MKRRPGQIDYQLLTLAVILLVFGLVMMYSASGIWADQKHHDSFYYLKKQLAWAVISLPLLWWLTRFDYNRLRRWTWHAVFGTSVALVLALFCRPMGGAHRWLRLGTVGFQPAEAAKLVMILFLADYLDRKRSKVESPLHGLAVPWSIVCLLLVLIGLEPDLGTPLLMFATACMILFVGGARMTYVFSVLLAALPVVGYELLRYPYRRQRLIHFLKPWSDAHGAGYQLVQSLLAVGSGGWYGKGLGASQLKLMYLPAPHTDFIFPIIAEELGLLGSLALLALFVMLLIQGVKIARSAPNLFGTLLAFGITVLVGLQAFLNVAMSVGLLPTKGVPLPFFSFGGSSLLVTMAGIGVLLNISRQGKMG